MDHCINRRQGKTFKLFSPSQSYIINKLVYYEMISFLLNWVLWILPASESSSASIAASKSALSALPVLSILPMKWEPPRTHQETQLQAEAIQDILYFFISSLDTSICRQNHAIFIQDILVINILHNQLVDHMWESYLAKAQQDNQNKHDQSQV